jgi:nitrogen-specific signal transduction histidine kinase/ActR/RegA family two-component response regulator
MVNEGRIESMENQSMFTRQPKNNPRLVMTTDIQSEEADCLKTIFDGMAHVVALVNQDLEVEMINRKGAELAGKTSEDLSGRLCGDVFQCVNTCAHLVCGQQTACMKCPLRKRIESTFRTKQPCHGEEGRLTVLNHGRKTILDLLISTTLIRVSDVPKVLLSLVDITEKKRLEAQVMRSQKMEAIGSLAGGIAHDFNNILFPIVGMSELLLADFKDDDPVRESLAAIHSAGRRGVDLVRQILAFSRQDEHRAIPVRIQQVIKEVVKLCRATIPAEIDIKWDLQSDAGLVRSDPAQIHQIGMNLITNAYHALENTGSQIRVSVKEVRFAENDLSDTRSAQGDCIRLSVSDNGCGIAPSDLPRIFDLYFTTNVYLPLMKTIPAPGSPVEERGHTPGGNETILVVDDDPNIAGLEKKILERLGYTVTMMTGSPEALTVFTNDPAAFDMVITDMSMPDMTGLQLAQRMLAVRPDLPIIVCTGFSEKINEQIVRKMGIKGYLMKPIVISQLACMVRSSLDGPATE